MAHAGPQMQASISQASVPDMQAQHFYRARRYAVKFDPPCIFLEYEDSVRKRRVRAVKLSSIQAGVDVDKLTRKVIRSFPRKIDTTSVKYDQVRKLVQKLVEHIGSNAISSAHHALNSHGHPHLADGGASPRLDTHRGSNADASSPAGRVIKANAASAVHASTDSRFSTSTAGDDEHDANDQDIQSHSVQLSPTSATSPSSASGDQHQHECQDGAGHGGGGPVQEGSDDLAAALDELDKELLGADFISSPAASSAWRSSSVAQPPQRSASLPTGGAGPGPDERVSLSSVSSAVSPSAASSSSHGMAAAGARSRFAAEAERLVIGLQMDDDTDLNKVTEVELKMAKVAMDEHFCKNRLKPGDPGYEYDKQVVFQPTEDNEWDATDEDDEVEASDDPAVDWEDIHAATVKL